MILISSILCAFSRTHCNESMYGFEHHTLLLCVLTLMCPKPYWRIMCGFLLLKTFWSYRPWVSRRLRFLTVPSCDRSPASSSVHIQISQDPNSELLLDEGKESSTRQDASKYSNSVTRERWAATLRQRSPPATRIESLWHLWIVKARAD